MAIHSHINNVCDRSPRRPVVKTATTLFVAGLLGALSGFPGHVAARTAADAWTMLERRPLRLPMLQAGRACPVSLARVAHSIAPNFGYRYALGRGPAYPLGFDARSILTDGGRPIARHGWIPVKVLWFVNPRYHGPVLVRGHQLGGPNALRFDTGSALAVEIRILAEGNNDSSGWSSQPTYTWTRSPGCYAYQVDGTSFRTVLVFRAIR